MQKKCFSKIRILSSTLLIVFLYSIQLSASESTGSKLPKHDWSFDGFTGTFDRPALQRGYKVYREVCSGCHSMRLLYYRDLIDIGFSEDQVKAIAAEYTVVDGPDDEGNISAFEDTSIPEQFHKLSITMDKNMKGGFTYHRYMGQPDSIYTVKGFLRIIN